MAATTLIHPLKKFFRIKRGSYIVCHKNAFWGLAKDGSQVACYGTHQWYPIQTDTDGQLFIDLNNATKAV